MGQPYLHAPSAHMLASALHLFPLLQARTSVCLTSSWSNFCHDDRSQLCQLIFPGHSLRLKQMNSEINFLQTQEQASAAVARELWPLTLSPTLRPSWWDRSTWSSLTHRAVLHLSLPSTVDENIWVQYQREHLNIFHLFLLPMHI